MLKRTSCSSCRIVKASQTMRVISSRPAGSSRQYGAVGGNIGNIRDRLSRRSARTEALVLAALLEQLQNRLERNALVVLRHERRAVERVAGVVQRHQLPGGTEAWRPRGAVFGIGPVANTRPVGVDAQDRLGVHRQADRRAERMLGDEERRVGGEIPGLGRN